MADIVRLRESKAKVGHAKDDLGRKIDAVLADLKNVEGSIQEEESNITKQQSKRDQQTTQLTKIEDGIIAKEQDLKKLNDRIE